MANRRLRSMLTGGGEAVLSIGLVIAFAALFMSALVVGFPRATSLRSLMSRTGPALATERPPGELEFESGGGGLVATLARTVRKVKQKPADYLLWSETREGMPLEDRHQVQTMGRSEARIAFDSRNEINLGENSLIVLRRLDPDRTTQAARASMLVLEGEIQGRISADSGDSLQVEIETVSDSRLRPRRTGGTTAFAVSVRSDGATVVSVHEGEAELDTGGETVVVGSNQAVTVDEEGQIGRVWELPGPPTLSAPASDATYPYRTQPQRIEFVWTPRPEADGYRLEIATDPSFETIVHTADVQKPSFVHGNLETGDYYWRVASAKERAHGTPGPFRRFRVIYDDKPPRLTVSFPQGVVQTDRVVLRGATEPGTRVFVVDQETPVSRSGDFERVVRLDRGVNVMVVEAVDAAGNTAYETRLVRAKY